MVSSTSILFILSTIASTTLAQQCYWPAGNLATGMVPCSSSGGGATTCCSSAEMCLSNGLCRIGNDPKADQFARGACTDANWGPGCLQHCAKLCKTPPSKIIISIFILILLLSSTSRILHHQLSRSLPL